MKTLTLSALAFALCAHAQAHAQIINVQIEPDSSYDYSGTGADPSDTGTTFNYITGNVTSAPLVNQNDGTTGEKLTITSGNGYFDQGPYNPSSITLLDGYAYSTTPDTTFELTGLTPDASFTLYLYGGSAGAAYGGPTLFTLASANGGAFGTASGGSAPTTLTAGAQYVVLTGTANSSGDVNGTVAVGAGNGGYANFNGFQINIAAPTIIPEPSTWAMMLGGIGALAFFARRSMRSNA